MIANARCIAVLALGFLLLAGVPAAHADVLESQNFRQIGTVPIGGVAVGGKAVGDTYFISSWQTGLHSYDISDPGKPVKLDQLLELQSNENEDLATNGEILLLSTFNRIDARNQLVVVDVSDPRDLKVIARLAGAGGHTLTCLYDCTWAYGSSSGSASDGIIIDLRNPSEPKLVDRLWSDVIGGSAHDVTEVRPGLVVTASSPMFALDTSDPADPRILQQTDESAPATDHGNSWPRGGTDRFLFSTSEDVNNGRCELADENGKRLQVYDTTAWRSNGFVPVGSYTLTNGPGHPPADALGVQGCSAHWTREHPSFRNGGLVAMAAYSHGVRLLNITPTGDVEEAGWFLKDVQGAIDVEWITDRIMYVVDDGAGVGGFDIVEYTGDLPSPGAAPPPSPSASAPASEGSSTASAVPAGRTPTSAARALPATGLPPLLPLAGAGVLIAFGLAAHRSRSGAVSD